MTEMGKHLGWGKILTTLMNYKVLIINDFFRHEQANIKVKSRCSIVIVTQFSRQSKNNAIWFIKHV